MGSRASLWARYGGAWGWPPETMTYEQDRDDLARHETEIAAQETFNYAVLDAGETELLGCVYIDPPDEGCPPGTDALVSWWVVDARGGHRSRARAGRRRARAGWRSTWRFRRGPLLPLSDGSQQVPGTVPVPGTGGR